MLLTAAAISVCLSVRLSVCLAEIQNLRLPPPPDTSSAQKINGQAIKLAESKEEVWNLFLDRMIPE